MDNGQLTINMLVGADLCVRPFFAPLFPLNNLLERRRGCIKIEKYYQEVTEKLPCA